MIGWLLAAVALGAFGLIALGWAFEIVGKVLSQIDSTTRQAYANSIDVISRSKRLTPLRLPEDVLDLERKLNGNDSELAALESYAPSEYRPKSIARIDYKPELPNLIRRSRTDVPQVEIDIAEIKDLLRLPKLPAYNVIRVLRDEPRPEYPLKAPVTPAPVPHPPEWTTWECGVFKSDIEVPYYDGILMPLNYFVERVYDPALKMAKSIEQRRDKAQLAAEKRNLILTRLHRQQSQKYEKLKEEQVSVWTKLCEQYEADKKKFFDQYAAEKIRLTNLVSLLDEHTEAGLLERVTQTLKLESLPPVLPTEFSVHFDSASRILALEHQYPDIGSINWVKTVALKSGDRKKDVSQREHKEAVALLYPALTLRLACEIVRLDQDGLVDAYVVNGWANYIHKSTGQLKRAYCSSLFAKSSQLRDIKIESIDPVAAFAALKGVAAKSLEVTPIAPILRLDTTDPRFVDPQEVLSNLVEGENLASMDWEDFEHLCRELFERAFASSGAEVKVTQASRDQGVDAIIFDPDVLRGGKIIVQAKRYTNTVDVSAVRDLYGAVINEGATKGILVTTSHFGPDAYSFAKDKPITLLHGGDLLGLLEKYGYKFRINLEEAKALNR
jgi:restriction system protein